MIGPVRNHPIILVKNSLSLVVLVIVAILFVAGSEFDDSLVIGIIAVCFAVVLFLIMLWVWQKTSFTFTDTEILVNKDTLFKQKRRFHTQR